jgi:hypothetical protein
LLLLTCTGAMAAEVVVLLMDGKIAARVDSLTFPPSFARELNGGLTNRLYSRVTLAQGDRVLGQKVVETAIRFDVWDQRFSFSTSLDDTILQTRDLAGLPEVMSELAAMQLPPMFDAAALPRDQPLTLRVEVLLNPIDREKMRMIRRWVAQNSTPTVGGNPGVSVSNALFNRIFEQYADGSDVAAAWRVTVVSAAFRIDALGHENR